MMLKRHLPKKSNQEKQGSKPTLIIDSNALCYMAKFTTGGLTYMGNPTGITFGFFKRIFGLAKKFKTHKFIFCWDAGITHRHVEFTSYKCRRREKRESTPEDKKERELMIWQIDRTRKALNQIGFSNNHRYNLYEGDDLIAIFAKKIKNAIMVSSDSDLYQLLDFADMYHLKKKKIFTSKDLQKDFGVTPSQWLKAKIISGCDSDEVPGITGIADAKKPTSKAISYVKGKITKGKIYDKINSLDGHEIKKRNRRLIKLPHPKCNKVLIRRRDTISRKKIIAVFDKLWFKSLYEQVNEWDKIFVKQEV